MANQIIWPALTGNRKGRLPQLTQNSTLETITINAIRSDGTSIDLSSYTLSATMRNTSTDAITAVTGTLTPGNGSFTWAPSSADVGTTGTFKAQFTYTDGNNNWVSYETAVDVDAKHTVTAVAGAALEGVTAAEKAFVTASESAGNSATDNNVTIWSSGALADGGAPPATLNNGTDITFTESPSGTFTPNLVATGVGSGSVTTYVAQLTRDANGRITAITAGQLTDNGDNTHTLADGLIISAPTAVEGLHVTDVDGGGIIVERDDGANSYKFKAGHGNASTQKIEGNSLQLVFNAAADLSGASTVVFDIQSASNIQVLARQEHIVQNSALQAVIYQAHASQSVNLVEYRNSGGSAMSSIAKNGAFKPASLADSAAENNTVYYSTTQSKLVYKDSGGVVNNLY